MKNVSRLIPLLSGIVTLSGCNHAPQKNNGQNSQKPNIIYIFADDLGIGDLSCYGATKVSTPNIDRLAGQGVQFTNAYATSATSTPSRFGLLTGMYPWRQENTGIAPGNSELIIDTTCVTMADMLKDAGYATGAVGKWHLGLGPKGGTDFNNPITPNAQSIGFDYEFIIPATVDRVPCVFVENGRVVNLDPNDPITVSYDHKVGDWPTGEENPELVKLKPSQGHNNTIINGIPRIGWMTGGKSALWQDDKIAETLTGKAISFIEGHKDAPFFLYFATQDAHVPRVPSPQFVGKSGMGPRGDCLLEFDWSVGQVLDALERLGLDKNTLVVLSSDNGPVVDDGYKDQAVELLGDHKPGGVYRGGKYSAYEAGTRVPCIWSWQGVIRPGTVSDALLCQIDWFATFAQMMNFRLPEGAAPDSEPLLNAWTGKEKKGREWLVLQNAQNNLSVTDGRWKYLRPGKGPAYNKNVNIELGNSMKPQLYDIKKDPAEKNNVAEKNPKIVTKMSEQLEKIVDGRYGLPL